MLPIEFMDDLLAGLNDDTPLDIEEEPFQTLLENLSTIAIEKFEKFANIHSSNQKSTIAIETEIYNSLSELIEQLSERFLELDVSNELLFRRDILEEVIPDEIDNYSIAAHDSYPAELFITTGLTSSEFESFEQLNYEFDLQYNILGNIQTAKELISLYPALLTKLIAAEVKQFYAVKEKFESAVAIIRSAPHPLDPLFKLLQCSLTVIEQLQSPLATRILIKLQQIVSYCDNGFIDPYEDYEYSTDDEFDAYDGKSETTKQVIATDSYLCNCKKTIESAGINDAKSKFTIFSKQALTVIKSYSKLFDLAKSIPEHSNEFSVAMLHTFNLQFTNIDSGELLILRPKINIHKYEHSDSDASYEGHLEELKPKSDVQKVYEEDQMAKNKKIASIKTYP